MRKVLVAFATIIFFLMVSPATVMGSLGETITCYLATEPVTIDGKWTSRSEWNDTKETKMLVGVGTGEGYFRIKHDASSLYVLAESLVNPALEYSDVTEHGDFMMIMLDTLHNEGSKPKTDDYRFAIWWNSPTSYDLVLRKGTGTDWGEDYWTEGLFDAKLGLDTGYSPHSPYPHVVGEFRIPLNMIGGTTFGLFIRGPNDSSDADAMWMYWPGPAEGDQTMDPRTWGTAKLSSTPIPEFSAAWLIAALSILAVPVILRSMKTARPADNQVRAQASSCS